MGKFILVLDAGGGGGRAFVVDVNGRCWATSHREWTYQYPGDARPLGVEFAPDEFWRILCEVSRDVMTQYRLDPEDIIAVSSTSMREACVIIDENGRELYAGPNRDARAIAEAGRQGDAYGEKTYRLTGHWPAPIFASARIPWLARHRPEVIERAAGLLMMNDWILFKLSGKTASEPTNAAESGLLDINSLNWSTELADILNIPARLFVPIHKPGTVIGEVNEQAAEQTGLPAGTPVVVGGADTQCGLLGSGAVNIGDVGIVAGTSTPVQIVMNKPIIDPEGRTWTCPYLLDNTWVVESNAGATGISLKWFRDSFYQTEMAMAGASSGNLYALITEEANESPIGSNGVLAYIGPQIMNARVFKALPGGFTVMQPLDMLNESNGRSDFARAILESNAFAVRGNLEQVIQVAGLEPASIRVCGGSAKSEFWIQMLADVLGKTILVPLIKEGSAMGAAVCAAAGVGIYGDLDTAMERMIRYSSVTPQASLYSEYTEAYRRWLTQRVSSQTSCQDENP